MTDKQNDRRQRKTRSAIKKALVSLLAEKDVAKITATDIADRADINRSTFYIHYSDAYAVLDDVRDDIADSLVALAASVTAKNLPIRLYELFSSVTEQLDGNPWLFDFLINNTRLIARVDKTLADRLAEERLKQDAADPSEVYNITYFAVCGIFGAYARWAQKRDCPLEKFCACMSDALNHGMIRSE